MVYASDLHTKTCVLSNCLTLGRKGADANSIFHLLKKFHLKSKVLSEEDKENMWFSKMIDEAEEEGGEVSEAEILKVLKRNGVKI